MVADSRQSREKDTERHLVTAACVEMEFIKEPEMLHLCFIFDCKF